MPALHRAGSHPHHRPDGGLRLFHWKGGGQIDALHPPYEAWRIINLEQALAAELRYAEKLRDEKLHKKLEVSDECTNH